ncbi:MAG: AAA family ATPase [Proteobacteria bacterium]|nr:MAG: AAA family ATPase [Pseudomonadota bacterium]
MTTYQTQKFGLTLADSDALARGVALGEYSLLLGAGFSLGGRNAAGKKLPKSQELAEELKQEFRLDLDIESPATLPYAYEDAVYKAGDTAVANFLRRRLTGCTPDWHSLLFQAEWRRVWTLNIDDLLAAVFRERTTRDIDFMDPYRVRSGADGLQIIYLHGRALNNKKKIFSIQEYHDSVRGGGDWHTAFFTEYKEQPFIVCGASLVGEFDLARTLRARNQSRITRDLPSVAIVKGISGANADRLRDRLGLQPVDATGEEFFNALIGDVAEYLRLNSGVLPSSVNPNSARIFGQQFQPLTPDRPGRQHPRQDFFSGDEPSWADIVANRDAPLSFSRQAVSFVRTGASSGQGVVGIFGDAGCGKSTTLLRVGRELQDYDVYLFRGDDDLDVEACLDCIGRRPSVLLFDDCADLSITIGSLARLALERNVKIGIVVCDREKRAKGIERNFISMPRYLSIDHSQVTPADAIAVVERRRVAKRLGSFGLATTSELRKLIISKHHGSLLSALSEIDFGVGFDQRLRLLADAVKVDGGVERLVVAVAQTHRWGYPLPLHFATGASGVSSETVVTLCSEGGALADVLFIERRGIRFRHRVLAEKVFDRTRDYDLLSDVAKSLVEVISPIVNTQAIRSKSYAHRLCKVLMDRRSVYATLGADVDKARQWYRDVEPFFGWNSRYWEQRALLELEAHNYSAAYSFARVAVDKENHPFPLTTFGTVCFVIAGHRAGSSLTECFDLYREGESALQLALTLGRARPETQMHPVTTFFEYAERLWPVLKQRPDIREKLQADWNNWLENADSVGFFRVYPARQRELRGWLLRTAVRGASDESDTGTEWTSPHSTDE